MTNNHLWIGDTVADAITNLPTVQIGADIELRVRFEANQLPNVFDSPEERHGELLRLVRWANDATVTVNRSSSGVSNYRESVPERAAVESFVRPVQFADGITRMPDFWCIVRGGEDLREPGSGRVSLRLDVTPLALVSEYQSRESLQAALGTSVV